ncbi:MAG TPA: hypothetical protein VF457_04660, partial [Burkholderiaceae bacterium]
DCTTHCVASLPVAAGEPVTVAVDLHAGVAGSGAVLGRASAQLSPAAGHNAVPLAFSGVVARVVLGAPVLHLAAAVAGSTPLTVQAFDASGAPITGSAPFAHALVLSDTDASGSTRLEPAVVTSPATVVALQSTGAADASPVIGAALQDGGTLAVQTASLDTLPSMPVVPAASFVDSIGVNTHLYYPSYTRVAAPVRQALVDSGVRHVRDGFAPATRSAFYAALNDLAAQGIRADLIVAYGMDAGEIARDAAALAPGALEAIEAPNEYDHSGAGWDTRLANELAALRPALKASPTLAGVPFIGPSLTTQAAYAAMAGRSSLMDFGNMHDYFAGFFPAPAAGAAPASARPTAPSSGTWARRRR